MSHKSFSIAVHMRREGGIANEKKLVDIPKFHSWSKCMRHDNDFSLRLNIQCVLQPMY